MSTLEPIQSGLRFRVLEGESHSELLKLERSVISLGRSTPETVSSPTYLTFPEPTVSRLHAVLTWEAGAKAFLLHHRSQTNPTIVNNVPIAAPQLLKDGDRIILGRLLVLVEPDAVEEEPTHEETAPGSVLPVVPSAVAPVLAVNALSEEAERTFSAPVKESTIVVSFVNDGATAQVSPAEPGCQEVRLPGRTAGGLRFLQKSEVGRYSVEPVRDAQPVAVRCSKGRGDSVLRVPLRLGSPLEVVDSDVIIHQDYQIWVGSPERCPDIGSASQETQGANGEKPPKSKLMLKFLNGPWQDATVTLSAAGITTVGVGPGDMGFPHPFPLSGIPRCEISVANGTARLRAVEVLDEHFLEVDGDLVLVGESVSLVGGSRLSLGDAEFLWTDGSERHYESFRLVFDDQSYSVSKSLIRIGTAAHCEVVMNRRELPPVVGSIDFSSGRPVYSQIDISASVRIDGVDTSTGLSVPLKSGSCLELRPGIVLRLESRE